jgi:hypothetical protein
LRTSGSQPTIHPDSCVLAATAWSAASHTIDQIRPRTRPLTPFWRGSSQTVWYIRPSARANADAETTVVISPTTPICAATSVPPGAAVATWCEERPVTVSNRSIPARSAFGA